MALDAPAVVGLPPSCKLVAYVLESRDEWAKATTIAEWTMLSERTVYYALGRLHEADAIRQKRSLEDRREVLYRWKTGDSDT